LEDYVASLQDSLAALNAKVDEAIAAAHGQTQAVEDRIAGEIDAVTARLHDGIVSPSPDTAAPEPVEAPVAVDPTPAPEPTPEPAPADGVGGWRPGQP
jgi:hypothetical protein